MCAQLAYSGANQTEDVHLVLQKVHLTNAQPTQTEGMKQRQDSIMNLFFQIFYIMRTCYLTANINSFTKQYTEPNLTKSAKLVFYSGKEKRKKD